MIKIIIDLRAASENQSGNLNQVEGWQNLLDYGLCSIKNQVHLELLAQPVESQGPRQVRVTIDLCEAEEEQISLFEDRFNPLLSRLATFSDVSVRMRRVSKKGPRWTHLHVQCALDLMSEENHRPVLDLPEHIFAQIWPNWKMANDAAQRKLDSMFRGLDAGDASLAATCCQRAASESN